MQGHVCRGRGMYAEVCMQRYVAVCMQRYVCRGMYAVVCMQGYVYWGVYAAVCMDRYVLSKSGKLRICVFAPERLLG